MVTNDREDFNRLRNVLADAGDSGIIQDDEIGFIVALVKRFKSEIDLKMKSINIIKGEIIQLQNNEKIILDMLSNMVAAAERNNAREESIIRSKNKHDNIKETE